MGMDDIDRRKAVLGAWYDSLRLFWERPVYQDEGLAAFARTIRPGYEGRVHRLWNSLVERTPPDELPDAAAWRETQFQISQLVFDCAEKFIDYAIRRDDAVGDGVMKGRHQCVRLAVEHARFEFETLWAFGRKLIAIGHHPKDAWYNSMSLGPQARDLDLRYAKALEAAYDDLDKKLQARCGHDLAVLLGVWNTKISMDVQVKGLGVLKAPWPDTDIFRNLQIWQPPKLLSEY